MLTRTTVDVDQFTAYLILEGKSDNTLRAYRALFVRWVDWCITEGRDPMRPDPIAVRAWSRTVKSSRSMLAQASAMIGHLCRCLETDEVQGAVPVPPDRRSVTYRGIEHEQAVMLAQFAETAGRGGTAVLIGLHTFARVSEIASLEWSRVDFDRMQLLLKRPKNRDTHDVPLHTRLAEHLAPRRIPGEQWLFPGRWGGHASPATVREWIIRVAEEAGVGHVTPHQLRHTSLTEANDNTGDLRAVQDLAGHRSPEETARYTRASDRRKRAAVESLDFTA